MSIVMAPLASGGEVIPVASPASAARLLPDQMAGFKATGGVKLVARDNLSELVADKAAIYREYLVSSAASREYAGVRIDVFETQNQFAAFGLLTFNTGVTGQQPIVEELGSGGARVDDALVFWKGNYFVRISDTNQKSGRSSAAIREALAHGTADAIVPRSAAVTPRLIESLPATSLVRESQRYILGPEALSAFVERGREMLDFAGDTEAVIGEYAQEASDSAMKLVIVECHTPPFATDAMARIADFVSALPANEQERIIVKRTGNYVVEALNIRDRELAESLIASIEYPYTVKWLRNPLWPTNDPFRTQKAAEMLLSTFGLLGLILMTVLTGGAVFGTTIFLKRRKRQREIFSDAGGMLRLDIDPFESMILGLPPNRDEG